MVTPIQGTIGLPDLLLVRAPRLIIAELKSEIGRLTAEQQVWLNELERCVGVETYVWRPRDIVEVHRQLQRP